ncbi:hypothetical protein GCM10010377_38630 [Streptomyces viridiviolaceus]|nr:hypothetical protein GCM10010377_38630 [Streptomyces viridiviolaceus]
MSSGTCPLRAWWAQRPPAAGAAVMATGIVSVGPHLTGHEFLSRVALVLACAAWLGLAVNFVSLLLHRATWITQAGTPGALTAVAATTVLGTRFSLLGRQPLAEAPPALAAVLWPGGCSCSSYGTGNGVCGGCSWDVRRRRGSPCSVPRRPRPPRRRGSRMRLWCRSGSGSRSI